MSGKLEYSPINRVPRRVFLSHTSEFRAYPKDRSFVAAAEEAVHTVRDAVLDMNYFTDRDQNSAEYCEQFVEGCDVYVGIIGFRYGTPVKDWQGVSYTQLEYLKAKAIGRPLLIFLLDDDAEGPMALFNDPDYGRDQEAFREVLKAERAITIVFFKNPDDLMNKLSQALWELPEITLPHETRTAHRLQFRNHNDDFLSDYIESCIDKEKAVRDHYVNLKCFTRISANQSVTKEITGAEKVSCITVRDKKGKYFIKFSVTDRLSLDKGPFNG